VEAAHVGARGLGQKCSDFETLPLCRDHHRPGEDSHHRLGRRFAEVHGLDIMEEVERFNEQFLAVEGFAFLTGRVA